MGNPKTKNLNPLKEFFSSYYKHLKKIFFSVDEKISSLSNNILSKKFLDCHFDKKWPKMLISGILFLTLPQYNLL